MRTNPVLSTLKGFAVILTAMAASSAAQAETWAVPLKGGARGSAWCVCRSIGTSPHIGQDWTKSGAKEAVAIQTGRIMELDFSSTCGYLATFVDAHNNRWRYVHLNRPSVATDTRVTRGNTLASISSYPTSSCGTGPHLHLERRSAGYWGDSPSGKTCDAGFETCYYNPNKPFAARAAGGDESDDADLIDYTDTARLDVADKGADAACTRDPALYPTESFTVPSTDRALVATVRLADMNAGTAAIAANAALADNPLNDCGKGECLTDWALYAQRSDGRFARVFYDNAVRGTALERVAEERFCAPTGASRYVVRATGLSGRSYWQDVTAQ